MPVTFGIQVPLPHQSGGRQDETGCLVGDISATGSLVRSLQSRQFGIICRERKPCRGSKVVSFSGKSRRYIAGRLAQHYTLDGRILRDRFNRAIACTSYDEYSRRVLTISPKTNMRPAVRFALFRYKYHYRTYREQGSVWTRLVQ